MAIQSEMTVSVSKGKTSETSTAHNNRKTRLKNASADKIKKFYDQAGHKHIHKEYTDLNEDFIKDPLKMYDKLFEKSILEYNQKQKRKDRKIGKGLALTVKEKQGKIALLTMVHKYKQMSKKKQQEFLEDLTKNQPEMAKSLKEVLPTFKQLSVRDTHKLLTQAKHAKTLGEALYDKQKHGKQTNTHVEFIFQIGSAEDFNEIDENGRIVKSYDRRDPNGIWQKSKRVLKRFEKQFEKENPNLVVTNWSIHMDESTPHMHLEAIPVAETAKTTARGKAKDGKYKRNGLAVKPSFDGALESEGFKKDLHDSRKAFKTWQNREAESLAKIMQNELGVTRRKGYTNKLKDVHEYKKVKEEIAKQREKAQNMKTIAENNAILANHNYDVYQKNAKAVKKAQVKLDNLTASISEAQKTLSNVQKERRDQLYALSQEMAQKRSEKLRELSKEIEEKRQKEEKKLKARETALTNRENAVNKRETRLRNWAKDLNAIQFGGVDSTGVKHKSIKERIEDGIKAGMSKVLHPLKAFKHAYLSSLLHQQLNGVDEQQIKEIIKQQEATYDKTAMVAALSGASGKAVQRQAVKAVGAGALAMAKDLPKYKDISDTVAYTAQVQALEKEDERERRKASKHVESKDITDTF